MSELPKGKSVRCRILLAEDNELNREIAAFLLKDEGISVTEAEDGYQAARAIRGSGKKDAEMIPIIAITANAFAEDKKKDDGSRYVSDREENNRGIAE